MAQRRVETSAQPQPLEYRPIAMKLEKLGVPTNVEWSGP